MTELHPAGFDLTDFLARPGVPGIAIRVKPKHLFFRQGAAAHFVFYLQMGRARLAVAAKGGKQATFMLLAPGDFFGEESLTATDALHLASAAAITPCTALRMDKRELVRVMHEEPAFSVSLVNYLLARSMRLQDDLVDQLFNSTEKRLARVLLSIAANDQPGEREVLLPKITQETLADLVGTTRSQVNFFMNRFRAQGLIAYKGRIRIDRSLLKSVLHD